MTPDRWRQISELFNMAVARPAAERRAVLAAGCSDDATLRGEVEALLVDHDAGVTFPSLASLLDPADPSAPSAVLPTGWRVGSLRLRSSVARWLTSRARRRRPESRYLALGRQAQGH